jgi:very-short-patch-repair endonuclease
MAAIDAAIAERARQQLGLITYRQLDELGCTERMRRARIGQGLLVPMGHRVLRVAGAAVSWEQRILALALDAGTDAVVSHLSAAALWGFHGIAAGAVEVSVPAGRKPRPMAGRVHRVSALGPSDRRTRGLFRLTSPERTVLDIAPRLRPRQLESILDHGQRDGLLAASGVRHLLDSTVTTGRPGVTKLRGVLAADDAGPRPESWLERSLIRAIRAAGLPTPELQVEIPLPGSRMARVDALYRDAGLVIEVDGHGSHATRRERQADAEREAALASLGYCVIRFTYEDVTERPDYVVQTIRMLLEQRGLVRNRP